MTKYILHGGFTGEDNDLNHAFYEELARDIPNEGTILLCYFASREDDNTNKFKEDGERITKYSHGKHFTFLFATQEEFLNQLKQSDALYIRGGSTNKLLRVLRDYKDFTVMFLNKTIAGSSAGAYALAKYGSSHSESEVREGLGVVPVRLVCHFESPKLPPDMRAVEELARTAEDLELVTLKDFEWRVFTL